MHTDSVTKDDRVLLVDDLVATGGTAAAAASLLRQGGAHVVGASFVIDLPDIGGADRLRAMDITVRSLVEFEGD
jgi:adenine phosphoribosyltransferase